MTIFKLPDLGEGLPDAEIREWYVKVGDHVAIDQQLVAMETAKAVVDVPCPQAGIITTLYGKPGDIIKTGAPLVAFALEGSTRPDQGTVVGVLEESAINDADNFTIGSSVGSTAVKATLAVRQLAKKLGVTLSNLTGSGEYGIITMDDVKREAEKQTIPPEGYEPLHGVRRAMLRSMVQSHQQVVPVSIFDEADIEQWPEQTDITVRLIRAIQYAAKAEPALNAWFDNMHAARKCMPEVHLGLAMDTADGLFVPVLTDVAKQTDAELRKLIDQDKRAVTKRTLPAERLQGATIILSNFGKFAGRFASPIIVPPMVAILAVGRLYRGIVATKDGKIAAHQLLPLSLSFDHRAVTGGEATRFLGALITALTLSNP